MRQPIVGVNGSAIVMGVGSSSAGFSIPSLIPSGTESIARVISNGLTAAFSGDFILRAELIKQLSLLDASGSRFTWK